MWAMLSTARSLDSPFYLLLLLQLANQLGANSDRPRTDLYWHL